MWPAGKSTTLSLCSSLKVIRSSCSFIWILNQNFKQFHASSPVLCSLSRCWWILNQNFKQFHASSPVLCFLSRCWRIWPCFAGGIKKWNKNIRCVEHPQENADSTWKQSDTRLQTINISIDVGSVWCKPVQTLSPIDY